MAGGSGGPESVLQPAADHPNPPQEVESNYSRLGEHLRMVTPPTLQCSVFCGGSRCRYENAESWPPEDQAIDGIYSHWITPDILAMARPNADVIEKKNIVQQFHDQGIRTVVNLQTVGEHANCGGPLLPGGFSYDPNVFMENNIFYYNFELRDHGEPTLRSLLDMIKVMAFAVAEGKVAVHCHAGLGRTGVLIACYLVYSLRVHAGDAVRYVRHKRPNSVQTRGQIEIVQEFELYILPELYVFCNREFLKEPRNHEFTFHSYMMRQRVVLHGYEARCLRYIPKLVYVVCERLLQLCGCGAAPPHTLAPLDISYRLGTPSFTSYFISAQFEGEGGKVSYSAPLSLGSPAPNASVHRPGTTAGTVTRKQSEETLASEGGDPQDPHFAAGDSHFASGDVSMPSSAVFPNRTIDQAALAADIPSCLSAFPHQSIDALLDDGVSNERLADNLCYQELSSSHDLRQLAGDAEAKCMEASDVYEALVLDHSVLGAEHLKQIRHLRHELNIRQTAWDRLATETNAALLTGLMLAWLEHLKTPLLSVDELSYLVLAAHRPEVVLRKLDQDTRYTVEYLVRFVARLHPLSSEQHRDILMRFIAALTQQAVPVRNTLLPAGRNYRKLREGTLAKCDEFISKLFQMIYLDTTRPSTTVGGQKSSRSSTGQGVSPPGTISSPQPNEEEQRAVDARQDSAS